MYVHIYIHRYTSLSFCKTDIQIFQFPTLSTSPPSSVFH